MSNTLVIVESPAKARTIEKYLGGGYTVKASVGHIRDLPKSNKNAVDIENGFAPHYEIAKGKERVVAELGALAKKAGDVILATDLDREGEAIAWHIAETIGLKHPKRIVFHEITKEAIREAIAHPRAIDQNLRYAQEARRVLDRLVGYDLSGLIWKKLRYGLSAGRVQSPALRILVEREREIRAFVPEEFFVLTADVLTKKKEGMRLVCTEEPRERAVAEKIFTAGKGGEWEVRSVEENEAKRSPRPPFITSTIQQAASSRLGFSPRRTMGIAQRLYEAGLITYMRTDSTNLSDSARQQAATVIKKLFGEGLALSREFKGKSKNAQEAHEAIRPTDLSRQSAGVGAEQRKLYELIWNRTVASQMADAKVLRTKVVANIRNGGIPDFAANGSRTLMPGWLLADSAARGEDVELPKVSAGDPLTLVLMHSEEKSTEPPPRYTEAGLVKELEKRGIGRPSTYASIIETIIKREYVVKEGRALKPTDTGDVVSSFLEKHFAHYIGDAFTAEVEDKLDDIANGTEKYADTLRKFYTPFRKDVKSKEKIEKISNLGDADASFKCPICGGSMIIKLGRSGKFLSCKRFPDCQGALTIEGKVMEGPKETGEMCPECKEGKLIERDGKYGKFVACGRYPKCRYIKRDESQTVSSGVTCPTCKKGELVERRGRFGPFWSC
ncbi:MAG: DNA topoisomerase I, partial [Parcubacteria group bacterium Gr01-1014_72]